MRTLSLTVVCISLSCSQSDGDGIDSDAGTSCPSLGTLGGERACPDGCSGFTARRVDEASECVTADELVVACFPESATVMGDGALECFRDAANPTFVIRSPSDVVRVEGVTEDLLVDHGWVRCEGVPFVDDCGP